MEFGKSKVKWSSSSSLSSTASNGGFEEIDKDLRKSNKKETPKKKICKFGEQCFRKNPKHFLEYDHPEKKDTNKTKSTKKITDFFNKRTKESQESSFDDSSSKKQESDYEIEDDSSDEEEDRAKVRKTRKTNAKERAKEGSSSEKAPKRIKKNDSKSNKKMDSYFESRSSPSTTTPSRSSRKKMEFESPKSESQESTSSKRSSSSTIKSQETKIANLQIAKQVEIVKDEKVNEETIKSEITIQSQKSLTQNPRSSQGKPPKPKLTPEQLNELIKDIFLFEMPKEFFYLWYFCKSINKESPQDALKDVLGLTLVGPYDILTGKVKKSYIKDSEKILCHWRFYYDPPEFQTLIIKDSSSYHIGYFRDDPDEKEPIVVCNDAEKSCSIESLADNLLAAVYGEIQKRKSKNRKLELIEQKLKQMCDHYNVKCSNANKNIIKREAKVNSKIFNNFGIVVPVDKNDVGYRPLTVSDAELKKILNKICQIDDLESRKKSNYYSQLMNLVSCVNFANDECDFGMGLELGLDLFCSGDQFFHSLIEFLLSVSYDLLNRSQFGQIIKSHIKNRRKGNQLSAFDIM